ncbi:hypothetical protein GYB22_06195 [bacterium]|nr:hypothetical protein [bacterium]
MKLKYLILFLFLCLQHALQAQDNGYSRAVNRITEKAIEGQNTDLEKVTAIHSWIINNIKYDVKKYLNHDYTDVSLDDIIKQKKAICYGYCKLFDAMCDISGITSVTVNGYVKSFERDENDSFYMDDHCWNAVLIDSSWMLVDATWDAGYIRNYKLTWLSSVAFKVFRIPYIRSIYKPKFVAAPDTSYFLRSGHYFSTDHLPALPMWQLMEDEISMKEFRSDSTFYFLQSKEDISSGNGITLERRTYAGWSVEERLISGGRPVYQFNKLNQYGLALSYYLESEISFEELLEYESEEIDEYEDILSDLEQSILYSDSMIEYLGLQYESMSRSFKAKREIQKNYTKPFLKYAGKGCKSFKTVDRKTSSMAAGMKRDMQRFDEDISDLIGSTDFTEAEFKHKVEALDSFNQADYVDSLQQEFIRQKESVLEHFNKLESHQSSIQNKMGSEVQYLDSLRDHFMYLFSYRVSGFDDGDYYINSKKDRFTIPDSNLFFGLMEWTDSLKYYYKDGLDKMKEFNRTAKALASGLKKLKRMQLTNTAIIEQYDQLILDYESTMNKGQAWLSSLRSSYISYKRDYKQVVKASCKAEKIIDLEINVEQSKTPFKSKIRAHKRVNKDLQKAAKRLHRKVERKIQKLS